MIRRMTAFPAAILSALLLAGAPLVARAQTTEVGGVKYEASEQLANTRLVLNGAGVRYKAIFKVYTAGLYLGAKEIGRASCRERVCLAV